MPNFVGGVEIYTLRLARAFQVLGHSVHILAGEPVAKKDMTVEVKEGEYQNIPVTRLIYDHNRRPASSRASYNDPLVTAQIKAILQKLQPDMVHVLSLSLLMGGTIEAASSLDFPLIYTATDFVLTCRRGTYLTWDQCLCAEKQEVALCSACMGPHAQLEIWLDRIWQLTPRPLAQPLLPLVETIVGKKAEFVQATPSIQHRLNYLPHWMQKIERIIAPSSYMRDMLILNDFPAERIEVSLYGVELPALNFKPVASSKLRFGFIGRIASIKGIDLLLEAFALWPDAERTHLTIYGSADVKAESYMQLLQNQATPLPNVKFAGFIDNANITQLYSQLDVLVVPSIWPENSPITILEAQAHGIPVIASDVKGMADVVQHEINGLIFANRDAQDLARQMARCLDSPDLVARLARNSLPVKSIHEDAGNLVRLYEEIVAVKALAG